MAGIGYWELADAFAGHSEERKREAIANVVRIDHEGVAWCAIEGGAEEFPCQFSVVSVAPGDVVKVRVEHGTASITGNASSPSVGGAEVQRFLDPVDRKATNALDEAQRAHDAADAAEKDADRARVAAESAENSADTAATAAGNAAISATSAANSASQAASDAASANRSANSALTQLSVVQDVAGTLSWISQHGTYTATADTSVVEGRVYFELVDGDYVPIVGPSGNPSQQGWYVLDVTDAVSDYLMAHLAVTSAGLWILPSGMGQSATPQSAPGYKLLLASNGSYMYDDSGHLVRSDTEQGTIFDSSRPQYIGGEDAYIVYYDSDNDGVPDSIRIGGLNVTIGGSSLSSVLADVAKAKSDAATAVQTAEDVPIVTLSSTNGTVFKRNVGVSTTIVATIFTPGGRIDNPTELHRRFGASAYLQWGWRDVVTDADHVLPSTDPRIVMDGFGLLVSPGDVDTQAVITCSLNY